MTEWTAPRAGGARRGAVHLSLFKGLLSVNAMTPTELKRKKALADLKSKRNALLADIGANELKVLFYGAECSDGAAAYAAEMSVHINRARAILSELEPLIAQLEGQPVQLDLLAS